MNEFPYSKNANTKYTFLSHLDLDSDVVSRLSLLLSRTDAGADDVYMNPIAQNVNPEKILSDWDHIYKSKASLINENLSSLEVANRSKFGPRSIAKPWLDRRADVKSYFEKKDLKSSDNVFAPASSLSDKGRLRPLSKDNALKLLKNDTNSGLPYYTRKSVVKSRLLDKFDNLLARKDPCVLFTRTSEGGKTRTLWGFPIIDTLNEMMFYSPLLEYQKKLKWRSAINGRITIDKRISEIVQFASLNSLMIISIDFSGFDASVDPTLIRKAFSYIKSLYNKSYHPDLDYICERFITIGIVTPDGVYNGEHGICSGSTFTNEVGSLVQYLVALSSGLINEDYFQIQGDDGIYVIKPSDYDSFVKAFTDSGLRVNIEKSYASSEYCVYLQNLHDIYYQGSDGSVNGIYSTYRALNRIIYQERWYDFEDYDISGKDYYAIRSLSILENCKHHPLFKEIVEYVAGLDKYNLQISSNGLSNYIKMIEDKQGKKNAINNQYENEISGLRNFESYKLVRQLKP